MSHRCLSRTSFGVFVGTLGVALLLLVGCAPSDPRSIARGVTVVPLRSSSSRYREPNASQKKQSARSETRPNAAPRTPASIAPVASAASPVTGNAELEAVPFGAKANGNAFRIVLETPGGGPSISSLKNAVVVVHEGQANEQAYSVTQGGVRKEQWLLAGLREQARAWGYLRAETEQRLPGHVGFAGTFPAEVTRTYAAASGAPGICCTANQSFVNGQWKTMPESPVSYPAWDSCDVRPYPSRFSWPNGVELWERVECTKQGKRSVLFTDPSGKHRARRQRQHSSECGGEPRLAGAMSGVALPDGGLLLAGNDCHSLQATTEYFPQGAVRSRILELPGNPGAIFSAHVAASDPVRWSNPESGNVIVVFPVSSGELPPRPYMARFDGKRWKDLSPPSPASGIPTSYGTMPNGGLWISTDLSYSPEGSGAQLWFDRTGIGDRYEEVLAPLNVVIADKGPWESPKGQHWFLVEDNRSRVGLMYYVNDGWRIVPVPTSCVSCGSKSVSLDDLLFLGEDPILALAADACGCVARLGVQP